MKTNLEIIREACIKANPEIMALEFGCEIKDFFEGTGVVIGIQKYSNESDCYDVAYYKIPEPIIDRSPKNLNWKILGRPIRLADVLLSITTNRHGAKRGQFISDDINWEHDEVYFWNLKQDDLRHQSEETLEFLASLLNKDLIK